MWHVKILLFYAFEHKLLLNKKLHLNISVVIQRVNTQDLANISG